MSPRHHAKIQNLVLSIDRGGYDPDKVDMVVTYLSIQ